eukprot:1885595-Rhodomonas_salina.3
MATPTTRTYIASASDKRRVVCIKGVGHYEGVLTSRGREFTREEACLPQPCSSTISPFFSTSSNPRTHFQTLARIP